MSGVDAGAVRAALADYLAAQPDGAAVTASDLADDHDLLLSGAIDSLGLLGLMSALREAFGQDIDFEDLDPEAMTVVGPLCRFVAERAEPGAARA